MRIYVAGLLYLLIGNPLVGQLPAGYWQQEVDYTMEIRMEVETNQFSGYQKLVYTNHSPDTLDQVFYHLYYNAFQPGSMMDVRSRTIRDPDPRVTDRISKLKPEEIGYQRIIKLTQDGRATDFQIEGTIMQVKLQEPILPGSSAVFEMDFEAQVPVQIRRTGRDNQEGIRYSMSQWYPKICEYDARGWHPDPYIAREFHSVWGNFDVTIEIDKDYVLAATGKLENADDIGYGYSRRETKPDGGSTLTWHFTADKVLDFVWAADPHYVHRTYKAKNGVMMHFFYQEGEETKAWEELPAVMSEVFDFTDRHFGKYPYESYAFIQGGDGGMEYPMATLITGHRSLNSLAGVSIHELMHSWFQMVLATNETIYPWMDEGFTSYASTLNQNHLRKIGLLPGEFQENPFEDSYDQYARVVRMGIEEPLTTHSDHYHTNTAYGIAAYVKGAMFLNQLEYIIGKEAFDRTMHRYFNTWKFKHPTDLDFVRIAEKESGFVLDWYHEYWIQSTKTIDYAIDTVYESGSETVVGLSRAGLMPMPLDVHVTSKNGKTEVFTIPLRMMRGAKTQDGELALTPVKSWPWVNPSYTLKLEIPLRDIARIEIDPTGRLADLDRENNVRDFVRE